MRTVTVLDLITLLGNAYRGAARPDIGFEDADRTLPALCAKLNVKVRIDEADIESCLWSCNLLNEKGKFWHPQDFSFGQFLKKLLGPGWDFDREYNLIKEQEK